MTAKRQKTPKARNSGQQKVAVDRQLIEDVLSALDASEQLLDLLRGVLNAGDVFHGDDLITMFMDRVIVSTRMQISALVPRPRRPPHYEP